MRISKFLFAMGLPLALAACGDSQKLPFARAFEPAPDANAALEPKRTDVSLAGGALNVQGPNGFCVSSNGLKTRANGSFAILARCDLLGQSRQSEGQPRAVITVTTAPSAEPAPDAQALAGLVPGAEVLQTAGDAEFPLALFSGAPKVSELVSAVHWRGSFSHNGQLVLLSLYAPEGSPALDSEGADILSAVANKTRAASTIQRPKGAAANRPPLLRRVGGLID